uniref:BMP7 n=1 Tax=Tegillarca granosa TaxID=220873 RepID=J7G3X1_TEGGR|nr:BMP7 [Tegillarca granosa]
MEGFGHLTIFSFVLLFICLFFINIKTTESKSSAFYVDNGVDQTEKTHELNKNEKRKIQNEILSLLGLHHRPKPRRSKSKKYSVSKFMINLYRTITSEDGELNENDDRFHPKHKISLGHIQQPVEGSDVIMSFVNRARKVPHLRHERDRTFYFDFNGEVTAGDNVVTAELRLYKQKARKWKNHDFQIQISMIRQGMDPEDKVLESEVNMTVQADHVGWLTLNVTRAADMWIRNPESNLGLYMRIIFINRGKEVDPGKFGIVGRRGSADKQPFMIGFFQSDQNAKVRNRRSALQQMHKESQTYEEEPYEKYTELSRNKRRASRWPCQRKMLYVKFRDLGWKNWIIAPDGFSAFYCDGECSFPLGSHMNATNHAIVQTLVHLMDPGEAPSPGCAPTKLSAQSVLYFDDKSNVVLQKFPKMIVKACGCH